METPLVGRRWPGALRALAAGALALIAAWAIPTSAQANGTPSRTAPAGAGLVLPTTTADVRVEAESLTIDFGDMDYGAQVEARYDLANNSARRVNLDVLFLALQGDEPVVTLGNERLAITTVSNAQLPPEWLAPKRLIDPRTGGFYEPDGVAQMANPGTYGFEITLPPNGRATLSVAYEAYLGYDRTRDDYVIRHLAYVLGPARNWAGFGTLKVTALVPSAYEIASEPALTRSDERDGVARYTGSFDGLPADILSIATVHRSSPLLALQNPIQFGLPLLVAIVVAVPVGRLCRRIRSRWAAGLIAVVVAGTVAAVGGVTATMLVMSFGPLGEAFTDTTERSGYLGIVLFALWAVAVTPALSALIAAIVALS
ncbi:MAG: hypothetical protein ACYC7H_16365, partial [Chloroflexota bacterium]